MYKGTCIAIISALLASISFAETCPSVNEIKARSITGWQAFDSDYNRALSKQRVAQFKNEIKEFALAEWTQASHPHGSIHCYYRDKNGSTLEAYLAKDNLILHRNKYWYEVSGAMHCAAEPGLCQFQSPAVNAQLAKNSA